MKAEFSAKINGFWITFDNGYTVSVQFGVYNYCRQYPHNDQPEDITKLFTTPIHSKDAEIAVISPSGNLLKFWGDENDEVKGWVTPSELLSVLNRVAEMEHTDD
jgi:hypothetical protein